MAKIVIALGGNALGSTPTEQKKALETTAEMIVDLHLKGHKIAICHGNGPQVGMILNAFASAVKAGIIPEKMPLSSAGAMSQGYIGLDIQNAILNSLSKHKKQADVVTLISQTLVKSSDPAFKNPSKPIGPFYERKQVEHLVKENGWVMKEDAGRGFRRVVPSPKPVDIVEKKLIRQMVEQNTITICGGGGGIPVYLDQGKLVPTAAVIDKDFTAAKIAELIKADSFVILTAVSNVILNFNSPQEKLLEKVSATELQKYLENNEFAEGSMKPKVQAALEFTYSTGLPSYIGKLQEASQVIAENKGTKIYK